tara:strand:- start:48782 stop:49399 length:618 start_codon:yes stop_codon:yes gene_type:complete
MKKKIKKHLADGLLIVFSVLFALFINKLYDNYQTWRKKEIAMESIAKELYRNERVLKDWKERHTQISEKLTQLIEGENDSLIGEIKKNKFFNIGLITENRSLIDDVLTSTAWESAKTTGIISEFDFETTQKLTRVYAMQEVISEKTIIKILDYYFEPGIHQMEDIEAILLQFQLRFTELVGQEALMAYLYEDIMKYFNDTKYAVP